MFLYAIYLPLTLLLVAVLAMLHSYVIFPWLLQRMTAGKLLTYQRYSVTDQWPRIYVLFSVFNEEKVIIQKIESLFNTGYPPELLEVYIGSDCSTDATHELIAAQLSKFPQLHFFPFAQRSGKAGVLNKLTAAIGLEKLPEDAVLVLTDANVMFEPETLHELAAFFYDQRVGQVGANVINRISGKGIAAQEQQYISRENTIKYREGLLWGAMQGAFGACYAVRPSLFPQLPENFLMEDFYVSMKVLQQGYHAILNPEALCEEDVPGDVHEEFKRKTRISTGNMQNLMVYWRMMFHERCVGFCFISHKVLRWLGPLWLLMIGAGLMMLAPAGIIWQCFLMGYFMAIATPLADALLARLGWQWPLLRLCAYFVSMNVALALGFWRYTRGVQSGAWSPTKRN